MQSDIDYLAENLPDNSFAQSLVAQWNRNKRLSPKQEHWVAKLANEDRQRKTAGRQLEQAVPSLEKLWDAMPEKGGLRYAFPERHLGDVAVKRPRNGKAVLYVTVGGDYAGAVQPTGEFRPSGEFVRSYADHGITISTLVNVMVTLSEDPVGALEAYGHLTGNCGVCGRELTDPESVARGIGPICASYF